eukprot:gnl/TRDRNA2_/TRDRNA2_88263_c0_seq1.p2 gnl/TRDRNA2_/TRDRNA2_88263_c0~~gnl/TRDRNA2_/TRDRNA2_88263_c0_seq1.p2  ORF type:complete len:137 (-),score=23.04 gnl/TRDRNA2_/TRDRNA2_88263_c0_seq1:249-659(-)
MQCHSIYPDNRITMAGQSQLGPTMFNIYGRASGQAEIQNKQANVRCDGILWTEAELMNYIKNPRSFSHGLIQMNFRGISDFQTRVDIVHYLKTLNWCNEKLANPSEKPPSFAVMRYAQMMVDASNIPRGGVAAREA